MSLERKKRVVIEPTDRERRIKKEEKKEVESAERKEERRLD